MKALTQYGTMAEKHWREHRPKMVEELETKGQLQTMLIEAERKTKDEMADLRIKLMKQGKTAEQAHRQAPGKWCGSATSCCRKETASHQKTAPVENHLNSYRITDDDRLGAGGPKQKFQQNLRAIQIVRKLESGGRDLPHQMKRRCWSNMSAGAQCPKSSTLKIGIGQGNAKSLRGNCRTRKNLTSPRNDVKRSLHVFHRHPRNV